MAWCWHCHGMVLFFAGTAMAWCLQAMPASPGTMSWYSTEPLASTGCASSAACSCAR